MTDVDAFVTGTLTYIAANGSRCTVPRGPCRVTVMDCATLLRWGNGFDDVVSLPKAVVDQSFATAVVDRRRVAR